MARRLHEERTVRILLIMAALAVWIINLTVASASSYHEAVYSHNGWQNPASAWWGTFSWAIDPSFPTNNGQGYNIRTNMREAMDAWNTVRWGDASYGFASETSSYSSAPYQYQNCSNCGGSNLYQIENGVCRDTAGFDRSDGPICRAYSELEPNWQAPNGELSFGGALAHEMGHVMALQHPDSDPNCNSVMSGCWAYRDTPGSPDVYSMHAIYGIPHNIGLSIEYGTTVLAQAQDVASYDQHYHFDLWKLIGGQWTYQHSPQESAAGGYASYEEDVQAEAGCGTYLYGIWAHNSYPDSVSTEQFGGYTNDVTVC